MTFLVKNWRDQNRIYTDQFFSELKDNYFIASETGKI